MAEIHKQTLATITEVVAATGTANIQLDLDATVLCNTGDDDTTFTMAFAQNGEATATENYVFKDYPLGTKDTFPIKYIATNLKLLNGQEMRISSANGLVAVTTFRI